MNQRDCTVIPFYHVHKGLIATACNGISDVVNDSIRAQPCEDTMSSCQVLSMPFML